MSVSLSNLISTTSKFENNYKRLINLLSNIIGNTIEKSVKYEQKLNQIELNKSFEEPKISIAKYIRRIIKHSNPEPSTLILGVIYFDRICNNGNIIFNFFNVYKLLLISFVLAIKFNEEYFETNQYYSKIGGLNLNNFNKLEIKVLEIINYDLYVYEDLYVNYLNQFSALIEKYLCKL